MKYNTLKRFLICFLLMIGTLLLSSCGYLLYSFSNDDEPPLVETKEHYTAPPLPDSVPSDLSDHVFLEARSAGPCESLKGKIAIQFVFVDQPNYTWNESDIKRYKELIPDILSTIVNDARQYGISVDFASSYSTAVSSIEIGWEMDEAWVDQMLNTKDSSEEKVFNYTFEKNHNADEATAVFLTTAPGRSYAQQGFSESNEEYIVIYNDPEALHHEINHVFGAMDFYFPDEVKAIAKKHFEDSIMLNSSSEKIDSLTAFLIGWTDELANDALYFLRDTSYLTDEILEEAHEYDTYTGYVTDRTFEDGIYTGYLVDGFFQGQGTFMFDDGDKYEGEWKNNTQHGKGKYTWVDGSCYDGGWIDGVKEGYGSYVYENGDKYEGNWSNDEPNGYGVYTWNDGGRFEGNWINGSRTGHGISYSANGDKYDGEWFDSNEHGKGVYAWSNGDSYSGDWSNGMMHGVGTYTWSTGEVFTGNWVNGSRNGYGKLTYTDGYTYEGNWENDKYVG